MSCSISVFAGEESSTFRSSPSILFHLNIFIGEEDECRKDFPDVDHSISLHVLPTLFLLDVSSSISLTSMSVLSESLELRKRERERDLFPCRKEFSLELKGKLPTGSDWVENTERNFLFA